MYRNVFEYVRYAMLIKTHLFMRRLPISITLFTGKEFSILLAPPTGGAQERDDGRVLYAIGTYVRYLDTDQNYLMLWRASVVEDSVID